MSELDRGLAERLREATANVTTSATAEEQIHARVRRRQRRRRLLLAGVPTVLVAGLVAGTLALTLRQPSTSTPAASPARPPLGQVPRSPSSAGSDSLAPSFGVDGPQASAGVAGGPAPERAAAWIPVAYGDAQVSVPPGSAVGQGPCASPSAPVTVFLSVGQVGSCPNEPTGLTIVRIQPMSPPTGETAPTAIINGIPVSPGYGSPSTLWYSVPALGVTVDGTGPLARQVLETLARSPRALAVGAGRSPRTPASWHRVSFEGVSVAVPGSWPVQRVAGVRSGCGPDFTLRDATGNHPSEPVAVLSLGKSMPAFSCPAYGGPVPVIAPVDGVVVNGGAQGALLGTTGSRRCPTRAGLRVCMVSGAPYGVLVLSVTSKDGKTMAVEIGLAGDGHMARTILFSLRPVGP